MGGAFGRAGSGFAGRTRPGCGRTEGPGSALCRPGGTGATGRCRCDRRRGPTGPAGRDRRGQALQGQRGRQDASRQPVQPARRVRRATRVQPVSSAPGHVRDQPRAGHDHLRVRNMRAPESWRSAAGHHHDLGGDLEQQSRPASHLPEHDGHPHGRGGHHRERHREQYRDSDGIRLCSPEPPDERRWERYLHAEPLPRGGMGLYLAFVSCPGPEPARSTAPAAERPAAELDTSLNRRDTRCDTLVECRKPPRCGGTRRRAEQRDVVIKRHPAARAGKVVRQTAR